MAIAQATEVTLVENGIGKALIVFDKNALQPIRFAAEELQTHIEKMSGARLPLVEITANTDCKNLTATNTLIVLGANAITASMGCSSEGLKPDGFRIMTTPAILAVVGRDDSNSIDPWAGYGNVGTLNGVHRLLEQWGVRWYFPGDIGTVIPHKPTLTADLNMEDAPYCCYRRGEPPDSTKEARIWARRIGFGATADYYGPHTSFDCWYERYGTTRPELFALRADGTRCNVAKEGEPINECWHSPAARRLMIKEARKFFAYADLEHTPCFGICENDGARPVCLCPECQRRLTPERGRNGMCSDYVAEAAFDVAEAIGQEHPKGIILIHAYDRNVLPPRVEQVPGNIGVRYSRNVCGSCWKGSQRDSEKENAIIHGWLKLKPVAISLGDHINFDAWSVTTTENTVVQWVGLPMVCPQLLAFDWQNVVRECERYNVQCAGEIIFTDGLERRIQSGKETYPKRFWWLCPDLYIKAKYFWNPRQSYGSLMREFYSLYFGPVAEPMRRFYERAEKAWISAPPDVLAVNPWKVMFTPVVLKDLAGYLEQARNMAPQAPYQERVNMIIDGFLFSVDCAKKNGGRPVSPLLDEIENMLRRQENKR